MPPREILHDNDDGLSMTLGLRQPAADGSVDEQTSLLPGNSMMIPIKTSSSTRNRQPWPLLAKREVKIQSKIFLPALQSMVLSKIPWFITLRILGEMDAANQEESGDSAKGVELAAAALATTLCNVTGLSMCVGFSFALSTLSGQAKGEMLSRTSRAKAAATDADELESQPQFVTENDKNDSCDNDVEASTPNTTVVFLLRGLIIQIMLVIPIGMWWLQGIDSFLVRLGQTPELAEHASSYLKILVPSLWVYSIQWTITAWCNSIGMADVPARASTLGVVLHVPFNMLFCYGLGLGYLGCAFATVCFQMVMCVYIVSYLVFNPSGRDRVLTQTGGRAVGRRSLTLRNELKIAVGSLRGFCDYLALAIPGIIAISEWWASEVAIFLSGRLAPNPQVTLSAMTIYQSINSFCFMCPSAFSIAGTARVGNLLGAGNHSGASIAGNVSVLSTAVFSGALGLLLYTMPHTFLPSLFVSEDEHRAIVEQTAATIPFLAVYVFADGVQTGLNGIIKGCGRQKVMVPIVLFAYWTVGVPLAYYFGLHRSNGNDDLCRHLGETDGMVLCGDVGLVTGMTIGTWVHMLLTATVVICTTDWKIEAYKAKLRVTGDSKASIQKQRQKQRKELEHFESEDEIHRKQRMRTTKSDGNL
mmetsp:Transcript_9532/g.28426  ORF Transcript_9532/g.28426 Transcript_9532/m.28426 type:complete len:644 (-) Transcript_9532:126-2057(-)|eukprot:CAMPEP_0172363416 /NCGR_PEP_ID=MMETSP1060-20121228/6787_1 /TAXON_ID=37318 /ORGANISM="Pseudo-nitzschia pungens, Strain cf. cingulata" /LENGTH=643 /DNA_ID=CAMNT_0013086155 /DNA_START=122 /DNA_END=2053 /DNA_ORIENTATION=+